MRQLGFKITEHRRTLYTDGHERPEVVKDRVAVVSKLCELEDHMPLWLEVEPSTFQHVDSMEEAEGGIVQGSYLPDSTERIIEVHVDQCCVASNDSDKSRYWNDGFVAHLRPKGSGTLMHVNMFVSMFGQLVVIPGTPAYGRLLAIKRERLGMPSECTAEDIQEMMADDVTTRHLDLCHATSLVQVGAGHPYWDGARMVEAVQHAADVFEALYPQHSMLLVLDHSRVHEHADARTIRLSKIPVERRALRPGEPRMRSGWREVDGTRVPFSWYDDDHHIGLREIALLRCQEPPPQKSIKRMLRAELEELIVERCPDVAEEPGVIERELRERGHHMVFLPKFHPELSAVEPAFAEVKRLWRPKCTYSARTLKREIPGIVRGIDNMLLARHARLCRQMRRAYQVAESNGDANQVLARLRRQRRSHRRSEPSTATVQRRSSRLREILPAYVHRKPQAAQQRRHTV